MVSTKCIEKFPDDKCPCFIIYKDGKPVSNIVNVDKQIDNNIKYLPIFLSLQGLNIEWLMYESNSYLKILLRP